MTAKLNDDREATAIGELRRRLAEVWATNAGEIDAAVERAIAHFANAPIRTYVPLLVERQARDELKMVPRNQGRW